MNLVVNKVVELQHVLDTNGNWLWVWLATAAIKESCLTRAIDEPLAIGVWQGVVQDSSYLVLSCTIKHRRCNLGSRRALDQALSHVICPLGNALDVPTLLTCPT